MTTRTLDAKKHITVPVVVTACDIDVEIYVEAELPVRVLLVDEHDRDIYEDGEEVDNNLFGHDDENQAHGFEGTLSKGRYFLFIVNEQEKPSAVHFTIREVAH